MIDHIVVDVEIQKTIEQVGGWDHTELMGVACAVLYEHRYNRFRVFGPDDVPALQMRLLQADKITGFNIWRFDFPVIWGLPNRDRVWALESKCNDLFVRVQKALDWSDDSFNELHKDWGLDNICKGTLGSGKTGYGGDAPKWFQEGKWAKLVDYCLEDVRLERDLGDFMDRYGFVINEKLGAVLRLKD